MSNTEAPQPGSTGAPQPGNTEAPQPGWPPAGGGTAGAGQVGGAGGYGYYGVPAIPAAEEAVGSGTPLASGYGYHGGAIGTTPAAPGTPAEYGYHGVAQAAAASPSATQGGYGYYGGAQSVAAAPVPTPVASVPADAGGYGYYGGSGNVMPGASQGAHDGVHHAGTTGAAAAPGTWSRGDRLLVILVGLIGGIIATVVTEGHFWLQNHLFGFLGSEVSGLYVFRFYGLAGTTLVTHAIFVGMLTRKPGATIATAAVSLVPALALGTGLEVLMWGSGVLSNLVPLVLFNLCGLLLVAGIAEAIQLLARAAGGSLLFDALTGLALPAGWLILFLLQYVLPFYSYPTTSRFSLVDWGVWLGLSSVWSLLVSGLVPAAIADRIRRARAAREGVSTQQAAGVPSGQGGGYGQAVPGQQPWGAVLPDHPSATTALVLGILGVVGASVLAPFAWGIASKAKAEIRQQPGRYREGGSVQAGYVLGIVGTVLLVIGVLAMIGLTIFYVALARSHAG
jgi:hypothetical protein